MDRTLNITMILSFLIFFIIGGTTSLRLKRLAGGESIPIQNVPYQVSIRYNDYHICGGSLISPRHVLTAAHCVANLFDEPYDELSVVTGTDNLRKGGTINYVKSVVWHGEFVNELKLTWINDIAVLTLLNDVQETEKQKIVELPFDEPKTNASGVVSGFGREGPDDAYPSSILRSFPTRILPGKACQTFIKDHVIRDTQICGVQKKGVGVCSGDSGGPLVHDGKIVGVSSWNFPCGQGVPDVYTNVHKYLDFIRKAMRSSCTSCTIL